MSDNLVFPRDPTIYGGMEKRELFALVLLQETPGKTYEGRVRRAVQKADMLIEALKGEEQ